MYEQILKKAESLYPQFPKQPTIDLGLAIKHIRLRMGMTQEELAENTKIKLSALRSLENGYAKFTKASNLEAIAKVLRVTISDIIVEGREWFPGNFFLLKLAEPSPEIKTKRKLKKEIAFKRRPLNFDGFQVCFVSAPVIDPSHFTFGVFEIQPGKSMRDLRLPYPNQIVGFVQRGTLGIIYDEKDQIPVFGNQCFSLRGDKLHHFTNLDRDNSLRFHLIFSCVPPRIRTEMPKSKAQTGKLSIGRAINRLRYLYSDWKDKPLTFRELSCLTGLDEKSLQYLESTTDPEQVIYWNKTERIIRALKMPLSRFLELAEGKDEGYLRIATAHDRAFIDYRHYLGVRIKSALFPATDNEFHISETYIEPKGGLRRATWKRTDHAMIVANVEDGELLVEVGKNRKAQLNEGESIYFDGSLGYIFTNPGTKPAKLIIATYPPIIF